MSMMCKGGGASSKKSFDKSIEQGYLPAVSSITHSGVYKEYYFDIGKQSDKLFSANLNWASSTDPFSGKREYYISVGLNSKYDGEGLKKLGGRPLLNLVILIDVSGSMRSAIAHDGKGEDKIELAKKSLNVILGFLKPGDNISILTFDTNTKTILPMQEYSKINLDELKTNIGKLSAGGGTDLSVAINNGGNCFKDIDTKDLTKENILLILTDAEPTSGDRSEDGLYKQISNLSSSRIYTTFIGMGVDFEEDLVEKITKVEGGQYISTHKEDEFLKQMTDDFDYLVTPIVLKFDVEFCDNSTYELVKVFGDNMNENNKGSKQIMKGSTLTPSDYDSSKGTKGGVVLLKLNTLKKDEPPKLKIKYVDRLSKEHEDIVTCNFDGLEEDKDCYETTGVRKAVLLTRFVNFSRAILSDLNDNKTTPSFDFATNGIPMELTQKPEHKHGHKLSQTELGDAFKSSIKKFITYFEEQSNELKDIKLLKELHTLKTLLDGTLNKPPAPQDDNGNTQPQPIKKKPPPFY